MATSFQVSNNNIEMMFHKGAGKNVPFGDLLVDSRLIVILHTIWCVKSMAISFNR